MSIITRPPNYYNKLDKFLVGKTVADINRETYMLCELDDFVNIIKVSCVFMRECENIE